MLNRELAINESSYLNIGQLYHYVFDGNGIDNIVAKKSDKPVDRINTLTTIGVAPFMEYAEQGYKSYTFIDNTEHKNIDVGPVNTQDKLILFGKKAENKTCYKMGIQTIISDKPLYAPKEGALNLF